MKRVFILLSVVILGGCTTAFGPEDRHQARGWHNLAKADVYIVYSWATSVRTAHDQLLSKSSEFVERKCGKNTAFHLTNHKLYPAYMKG